MQTQKRKIRTGFCPADKLVELYDRAKKNGVDDPGGYAVKNWIVKAQGFLIGWRNFRIYFSL